MQKLTFRERIKDTAVGLGDSLKGSQFWSSIFRPGSPFRKGYSDSPRNRAYVVMNNVLYHLCLLYTSPSPRDLSTSRMPSSA